MFYVYAHIDPFNKEVFYVGSGSKGRAYERGGRNVSWEGRASKISRCGLTHEISILHICETREEAFDLEKIEIGLRNRAGQKLVNSVNSQYKCENVDAVFLSIGEFVRRKRKETKLTQPGMAERAGVGLRFVRELEASKKLTLRIDKINSVLWLFGARVGVVVGAIRDT